MKCNCNLSKGQNTDCNVCNPLKKLEKYPREPCPFCGTLLDAEQYGLNDEWKYVCNSCETLWSA